MTISEHLKNVLLSEATKNLHIKTVVVKVSSHKSLGDVQLREKSCVIQFCCSPSAVCRKKNKENVIKYRENSKQAAKVN